MDSCASVTHWSRDALQALKAVLDLLNVAPQQNLL